MRGFWLTAVATPHLLMAVVVTMARSIAPQLLNQSVIGHVQPPVIPLRLINTAPGKPIKPGTELRILTVGDSITYGFLSDQDGGDGNGYRLRLRQDLSKDKVVFAGTETSPTGNMTDGYFAAWNGKTIQYISEHVTPSLEQRPNIILLHAGTNDMNPDGAISTEGHDPAAASERLGSLIDKMTASCPDAVILVAMIIGTCNAEQAPQTKVFQSLIPKVVAPRLEAGKHVLAVDFTTFAVSNLRDCIHPTNQGYQLVGYYWHDFIAQIPRDWITAPVGQDPQRPEVQNLARRLHTNMSLLGLLGLLLVLMYL
ncbi:carbohydrate esterase family 3 protein [Trichoderma novae-zelandiae]